MAGSNAINRIVIVKFFNNDNPKSKNTILTRTLGKLGVIDAKVEAGLPKPNEFWKVKIVKETCPGKNTGCFILEPIAQIEIEDLSKLVPGMYKEKRYRGLILIKPNTPNLNWILALSHKHSIQSQSKEVYAILVDLSELEL